MKKPKSFGRPFDAETIRVCAAIRDMLDEDSPMTVRQVFYRCVVAGLVPKDEGKGYQKVIRYLGLMRMPGAFRRMHPDLQLDWNKIIDGSHRARETSTVADIGEALNEAARCYRLDALAEADTHVEVWIEKEALAAFVWQVCAAYDVPLLVSSFASHTNAYLRCQRIAAAAEEGKPTTIYQLTDYDPSGAVMEQHLTPKLRKILRDLDCDPNVFTVKRIGLTRKQIDAHDLPTRPTKRGGNRHAALFDDDDSVELDALPPNVLRSLVRRAIERHVPPSLVDKVRAREAKDRRKLERLAADYGE